MLFNNVEIEMDIELNFEAGNAANPAAAIAALERLINYRKIEYRVESSSYNGPDGEVNVQTCVVRFDADPLFAAGAAYALAKTLEEDCVALRFETGCGVLVGPNAAKWGDYNPEFFIPF